MLDLGWQEFMLIAVVAVIVVGPKDLPKVIRTVTTWIRKARGLASDFQRSLDEVARESELDELRKQVQSITKGSVSETIKKTIDEDGTIEKSLKEAREESGAEEAFEEARRIAEQTKSYTNSADIPHEEPSPAPAEPTIHDDAAEPETPAVQPVVTRPRADEDKGPAPAPAVSSKTATGSGGAGANEPGKRVSTRGVPKPVRSPDEPGGGASASMAEV